MTLLDITSVEGQSAEQTYICRLSMCAENADWPAVACLPLPVTFNLPIILAQLPSHSFSCLNSAAIYSHNY